MPCERGQVDACRAVLSAAPKRCRMGFRSSGNHSSKHYRAGRRERSAWMRFLLRAKSGSLEVFQVRMRWALSPSRRNRRRTHSSVTEGSSFRRRQYSASLETDQTENGKPRSAGLDRATSTSSRSCAARTIGGRPRGLGTSSKRENPL